MMICRIITTFIHSPLAILTSSQGYSIPLLKSSRVELFQLLHANFSRHHLPKIFWRKRGLQSLIIRNLHLSLLPPGKAVWNVGGDAPHAVGVTADVAGDSHDEERVDGLLRPLRFIQWM